MERVIYNLPVDWSWIPLGQVATLLNGRAYKQTELLEAGPTPVLRVGNFFSNRSWYYSDLDLPDEKYCEEGDLLYAWSASFGPRIWQGPRVIYHYHIWKILTSEHIDKKFLFYLLEKDSEDIKAQGNGVGMFHATKGGMEKMLVPLPPISEQKRIVEKLDALLSRIDTTIEHLQEGATLKNSLLQSALDEQFSAITERMTIESLAEVKGGKRLPKGEKLSDDVTDHPYIRVADFTDKGTIDLSDIKYISREIHEQIKRYIISKDDLYISIAGTIGKTGFVPPELDGANLTENAAKLVIRDKQQLDLSYLYLFTLTSDFSAQAGLATKTVAQPKLALTRLSKIEIPLCSLEEQKALVSTIETLKRKIHDAEEVLLEKIEDLKSLKASILDSAFKGEL